MKILFVLGLIATGVLGVIHIISGAFTWLDVFAPVLIVAGLAVALLVIRLVALLVVWIVAAIAVLIAILVLRHRSGKGALEVSETLRDRVNDPNDPRSAWRKLYH